jgi:hypothetical protein
MSARLVVASALAAAILVPRHSAAREAAPSPVDLRGIWKERDNGKEARFDAKKAAARGLDPSALQMPRRLGHMPVSYSQIEGSRKQSGTVRIGCRLAVSGYPEDCVVTRRVAPLLDEAALASVLGSLYTPLTVNGVPHPALVELSVRFTEPFRTEPSGRTADPSGNLVEELRYKGREYDVRDP